MSATTATQRGRNAAAALMVDRCTITAEAASVYDPETDSYQPAAGAVRYAGPCRVKPTGTADRVVEAAGQTVALWPYVVSVPMTAVGIELDDRVTVTAAADPDLVGLVLRVRDVPKGSLLTARRLGCEVQSA